MKTAIILGATGLTGSQLLDLLLHDERFDQVKVLVRRSTGVSHAKLEEHIIDFDQPESWASLVTGDMLFSTLGATRANAGGTDGQYKVDYTYQYQVAEAAASNGVKTYVLVSSTGADANSSFFYMRMKGELDRDVQQLPFEKIRILRPGPLDGDRKENRPFEKTGLAFIKAFNQIGLFKRYRPIHVREVAKAMIHAAFKENSGSEIYESEEVFVLAAQ